MEALAAFFTIVDSRSQSPAAQTALVLCRLALLAVGGGTYFTLNHWKNQAVSTAVAGADANATIQTYRTKDQAEAALVPIQEKEQAKADPDSEGLHQCPHRHRHCSSAAAECSSPSPCH
jgi:hypothetical protein